MYVNKSGPNSIARTQTEVVSGLAMLQPHHTNKDKDFQLSRSR